VLEDGATQSALVTWEALFVPDAVWTSQRIASETGIRPENLPLSGFHDHGARTLALTDPASKTAAYTRSVEDAAVDIVRRAKSALQPGRFESASARRTSTSTAANVFGAADCGSASTKTAHRIGP
jgi:hypothetical protein